MNDTKPKKLIKAYFYLQRGMSVVNEFKYVLAGIFALYYALKLDNPLFIPLAALVVLPILTLSGYIYVHWIAKPIDWLNIEYATYWQRYSFQLQEKQNELIEKLLSNQKPDTRGGVQIGAKKGELCFFCNSRNDSHFQTVSDHNRDYPKNIWEYEPIICQHEL